MIRLFLDASVLFSAALSKSGGARAIVDLGYDKKVELVVSSFVLEEARRNLANKVPNALPAFETFILAAPFVVVEATRSQVVAMAKHTVLKDAPVVAAAKRARTSILVSLDKKHLIGNRAVEKSAGLSILTPGSALQLIRKQIKP